MKPRFRAEWVVVREELLILASCLLRPMSRTSVLEEFGVRRFAVIQESVESVLKKKKAIRRERFAEKEEDLHEKKSTVAQLKWCRPEYEDRHSLSTLCYCISVCQVQIQIRPIELLCVGVPMKVNGLIMRIV